MSMKKAIGIAAIAALGCGATCYFWLRERSDGQARASESTHASEPMGVPGAELPTIPPTEGSLASAPNKSSEPVADGGLPLRGGEVLEYTANVANLSDVASLKLQVGVRKDFFGKNAWHLQAFAHTQNPFRILMSVEKKWIPFNA
jgi:hypothetical protein